MKVETLREDSHFTLSRRHAGDADAVLVLAPVSAQPLPDVLRQLANEYALSPDLDSSWAAKPLTFGRHDGRAALFLQDFGGDPVQPRSAPSFNLTRFLTVAIGVANALGQVHRRGIVHKDIKPANVLVDNQGQVRLTGFGIASRIPRERPTVAPPEIIAGTFAYMAPEQTGRMNRSIDARSDLYSLGVTLYEMLTGLLPFSASDPGEWIHCHVARPPPPPCERAEGIPEPLEAIVLKLLAKTPEDRYQTAAGVETDLRACLDGWEAYRRIDSFLVGIHDVPEQLIVPERMYGREAEIGALAAAFDRVVTLGRTEWILLSGRAGIGKSFLVNELHKRLALGQGLFAAGKVDQYERDIPYATLAQAFQSVVRQLLGRSDEDLARWRRLLLDALGPDGQLMVSLVPQLGLIIGEQPPFADLAPRDAQVRFQLAFRRLLGTLARPEHPLIIFLDDLQWIDAATLQLLERIVTEPEVGSMLMIGAYRDDEVGPGHPLTRTLAALVDARGPTEELRLGPLPSEDVGWLIADALHADRDRVQPIAELMIEKTGGNPLFAIQFLTNLTDEALIAFDTTTARWNWDLDRIRAKRVADNVADLVAGKLGRLPDAPVQILKCLACMGIGAETATLGLVLGLSEGQVHASLLEALRSGLIFNVSGSYWLVHDRVQEAAYALIQADDRAALHLQIARVLSARTLPSQLEEHSFEIASQFNRGAARMQQPSEREQAATFNLIAGRRAKSSTAYASALAYFVAGEALLPVESWERCYRLAFDLERNRAECELLTGAFGAAEERLSALSVRADDLADRVTVARLRMRLYTALNRFEHAVEVGLEYFRHVGLEWPACATAEDVRQEYHRMRRLLDGRQIEQLFELPLMADSNRRGTMDVLAELLPPAFLATNRDLHSLALLRMTSLSVEYGNCDASCFAYSSLNCVLGFGFGDYQAGFRFGQLACALVDERGLGRFRAGVYTTFGRNVMPWTKHLSEGRPLLRRAVEAANAIGDLTYANYGAMVLNANLFVSGEPLGEIEGEVERGLAAARRAGVGFVVDGLIGQLMLVRALRGASVLPDQGHREEGFEQHLEEQPHLALVASWYWIQKLQARFFAGDYASGMEAAAKANDLLWVTSSMLEIADFHFYDALTRAAVCDSAVSSEERDQHLRMLASHHEQITTWADNCPENFANRAALVGAEIARLEGRELDAERLYEKAIRSAREHGFVQNEGLANELAARFHAARGLDTIADVYLCNARSCYVRWGADAKVRQLDESPPRQRTECLPSSSDIATGTLIEHLDLAAVIKVSQAVSSEIDQRKLINTLMVIAIEHAGADRGLLILPRSNDLRVEAEATTNKGTVEVRLLDAAVTPSSLPESILRYVARTRESVFWNDAASDNSFSTDDYLLEKRCRSVLCLPLIKQTKLIGILYLENSQTARVFTPARSTVLKLLASQAAISLENARLFADLQHTQEYLAEAQRLTHTGSFSYNANTGELFWSEETYRIHQLEPYAKVTIDTVLQYVHPEDRGLVRLLIQRRPSNGETLDSEYRMVMPDGSVKYIHAVSRAVIDDAGALAVSGTLMDVTASWVAHQKLQNTLQELFRVARLTTMGELAVSIAHEVNQPLMAIVTNAAACVRWLAEDNLNVDEARWAAERIIRAGHCAGDVIQSVRALTRKSSPVITRVSVTALIHEVLDLMRAELQEQAISLDTQLPRDLGPIGADRVQVQQVMLNLIRNAAEAMSTTADRPRILSVSARNETVGRLLVAVSDTGTGIDPSNAERMFEAFFTTKADGIGLGLSICRSIVEAHGGRLWAAPNLPSGSIFQFTLPMLL